MTVFTVLAESSGAQSTAVKDSSQGRTCPIANLESFCFPGLDIFAFPKE